MFGLIDIAGHAQTVRPLLAPMAESAAEKSRGKLDRAEVQRIHALSAATDNVGRFFGEDVFLAFGARAVDSGFLRRTRHHARTAADRGLGDSHRGRRVPDPRRARHVLPARLDSHARRKPPRRTWHVLRIEYFYWLLAAFLLYAGWRNLARAPLFARRLLVVARGPVREWGVRPRSGESGTSAAVAGRRRGRDRAGIACATACAASTWRKRRKPSVAHRPLRLGHRLFVPALLIPLLTVLRRPVRREGLDRFRAAVRRRQPDADGAGAGLPGIGDRRHRDHARAADHGGRRRTTPARHGRLGRVAAADARRARRRVRGERRRRGRRFARLGGDSGRQPHRLRARLRDGHGRVHDHHGQCVRRLPRDDRGHRPAAADPAARRRSGDPRRASAWSPATAAR